MTRDEAAATVSLPAPEDSGIEHIIVVTMENRSFDHFLGWFPNADTRQHATYPVYNDGVQTTYPLAPDYQGCGHPNPDHSYSGERIDYNAGAMNGWLLNTNNDKYCVGFYRDTDIPFLAAVGRNYVTLDHYFSSFLGPTFPNRLFLLAAQTDRLDDSLDLTTLPTIFDRLSAAGVSARYYFNNVPFVGLWGLKYLSISHLLSEFLSDAAAGTLPAVSFVDPRSRSSTTTPARTMNRIPISVEATLSSPRLSTLWPAVQRGNRRCSLSPLTNAADSLITSRPHEQPRRHTAQTMI